MTLNRTLAPILAATLAAVSALPAQAQKQLYVPSVDRPALIGLVATRSIASPNSRNKVTIVPPRDRRRLRLISGP